MSRARKNPTPAFSFRQSGRHAEGGVVRFLPSADHIAALLAALAIIAAMIVGNVLAVAALKMWGAL